MSKATAAAKLILSIIALTCILLAAYHIVFETEENKCSMTYMFQMPEYKPLPLAYQERLHFPSYRFFLYDEGNSLDIAHLRGIPVLFIPGNGGSYKQARSLGSIALRMAESRRTPYHFNMFAVDFNEELTAFHGTYVRTQTDFVALCINKILKLYSGRKNPPKKIILVGHSMGGFVARNLFLNASFDASAVDFIVTLSTPHIFPAFLGERSLMTQYEQLNSFWSRPEGSPQSKNALQVPHVALISLSGGLRDFQVWDAAADVTQWGSSPALWLSTEWVRGSWSSTDHLCIVWCKEIVLAVSRSLFEIAEKEVKSGNQNPLSASDKLNIFRKHMVTPQNSPSSPGLLTSVPFDFKSNYRWLNYTLSNGQTYFPLRLDESSKYTYVKVGPLHIPPDGELHVTASVIRHVSWTILCQDVNCAQGGVDVSHLVWHIPPFQVEKRWLQMSHEQILTLLPGSKQTDHVTVFLVVDLALHHFPLNLQVSVTTTNAHAVSLNPTLETKILSKKRSHVWHVQMPFLPLFPHQIILKSRKSSAASSEAVLLVQEDPWQNRVSLWTSSIPSEDLKVVEGHVVNLVAHSRVDLASRVTVLFPFRNGVEEMEVSATLAPVALLGHLLRSLAPSVSPWMLIVIAGVQALWPHLLWPQERTYLRVVHLATVAIVVPSLLVPTKETEPSSWVTWLYLGVVYGLCCALVHLATILLRVLVAGLGYILYAGVGRHLPSALCTGVQFVVAVQLFIFIPVTCLLAYMDHLCFARIICTALFLQYLILFATPYWDATRRAAVAVLVLLQLGCYVPDILVWAKALLEQRQHRHPQWAERGWLLGFVSPLVTDSHSVFFLMLNVVALLALYVRRWRLSRRHAQIGHNRATGTVHHNSYSCVLFLIPYGYMCIRTYAMSLNTCAEFLAIILLLEAAQPILFDNAQRWTSK